MTKPIAFKIILPDVYHIPVLFTADLIALHQFLGEIIQKYQLADERLLKEAEWIVGMSKVKALCPCNEAIDNTNNC